MVWIDVPMGCATNIHVLTLWNIGVKWISTMQKSWCINIIIYKLNLLGKTNPAALEFTAACKIWHPQPIPTIKWMNLQFITTFKHHNF